MTEWKPDGEPKQFTKGTVQYLRARHEHEGAYDVALDDGTVRVLPGGDVSTRTRLALIASALDDLDCGEPEPVAYVVGVLALHGVRNLEIDDEPIFDTPAAEFRVVVTSHGTVRVFHDGGAS